MCFVVYPCLLRLVRSGVSQHTANPIRKLVHTRLGDSAINPFRGSNALILQHSPDFCCSNDSLHEVNNLALPANCIPHSSNRVLILWLKLLMWCVAFSTPVQSYVVILLRISRTNVISAAASSCSTERGLALASQLRRQATAGLSETRKDVLDEVRAAMANAPPVSTPSTSMRRASAGALARRKLRLRPPPSRIRWRR